MKDFYLPGLHQEIETTDKSNFLSFIEARKGQFPKMYTFMTETDKYLSSTYPELNGFLNREKRLLVFETPNRVKVTHEYDYTTSDSLLEKDELYYLFNPANRLNWLKIFYEKQRIIVGRSTDVKSKILLGFDEERKKLLDLKMPEYDSEQVINDKLWGSKHGYPCFIMFPSTPTNNFIIETECFESIRNLDAKENTECWLMNTIKSILYPFEERNIEYQYKPSTYLTSWLYCKAPKGFQIELVSEENNNNFVINDNNKDKNIEADPEVCFSTFISKNKSIGNKLKFNIHVLIPKSLKFWYKMVYYMSLIYLLFIFVSTLNLGWVRLFGALFNKTGINQLIDGTGTVLSISLAFFASIITTRSWLITEETILKKYSNAITFIASGIISCTILLILMH